MVGILTAWQTYYISKNVTTIESFENEKIDDLADRGRIHPDDAIFPCKLEQFFLPVVIILLMNIFAHSDFFFFR